MPIIIIPSGKNTIVVPTPSSDDDVQLTHGESLFVFSFSICFAIFVAWLIYWGTRR